MSWWLVAAPAAAAGPATNVAVQLSPASIVADGSSTSTVTATVSDASSNPVIGNAIGFSATDGAIQFGSVTDHGDGTYTATLTSSTTVGSPTITATDTSVSPSVLGTATLTQTLGAATSVSLGLSPTSIVANGSSTSTATAMVTDSVGHPLASEPVSITSNDTGEAISSVTDHGDGTYTATIRSSTSVHVVTITATDTSASVSGTAPLSQTPGPATAVSVQLSPPSIVANGTSTSTATATVTDASGHPLAGEQVNISSNDAGETIGSVSDNGNGTYTATIRSSTTAEFATITATVTSLSPPPSGQATLTQAPNPSTTALSPVPTAAVSNEVVTLIATVTSSLSLAPPTGSIAFENGGTAISGCANVPVGTTNQSATVTCQTSFSASTSAEQLSAVFTPSAGANIAGSTSPTYAVVVGRDSTSTTLKVPSGTVHVPASMTLSATVASIPAGPFRPSGSVRFLDGGTPIPKCVSRPLTAKGTAACKLSYRSTGTHHIKAVYSGDANFSSSTSSPARSVKVVKAPVKVLGTISSIMQWTFLYTPTYTKVLALVVSGAPIGATLVVQCHGHGCPFAKRSAAVPKPKPCKRKSKRECPPQHPGTVDLVARFPHLRDHRLQVGAQVVVRIVRPSWIGKYYDFLVRPRRAPRIQIACLAPGSTRPGVGC